MLLETYLTDNNVSIISFAEMIGVSPRAVANYKKGHRIPAPDVMRKITEVTNGQVTANDFYSLANSINIYSDPHNVKTCPGDEVTA